MEFENTPQEMAEKLMEFIRYLSDDREEIENEIPYVAELFEKLQNSNEFNALVHHLDIMFMDQVFSDKRTTGDLNKGINVFGYRIKSNRFSSRCEYLIFAEDEDAAYKIIQGERDELITMEDGWIWSESTLEKVQNPRELSSANVIWQK